MTKPILWASRFAILAGLLPLAAAACLAQSDTPTAPASARSKVMGQVNFAPATKLDRNAGVWIDGQYVGYVHELKGDKKILLLPGSHEIIVEPGSVRDIAIRLERDPRWKYSEVTAEIKIKVTPDRAAVFVDGSFAGYVHEFGGVGRSMLLAPGKHQIKIALPGYKDFTTEVNLSPNQKFILKTDLLQASITEADPAVKKD